MNKANERTSDPAKTSPKLSSSRTVLDLEEILMSAIKFSMNGQIDNMVDLNVAGTRTNVAIKKATQQIQNLLVKSREIFIPVKGYEGLYEVSNTGKVRSVKGGRRQGIVLKPSAGKPYNGKCYWGVSLSKDGRSLKQSVHRIVAKAFLSNPESKPCVNHLDGDPSNNDVSNLAWATYSENEKHSYDYFGKQPGNKGRNPIKQYLCLNCGNEFEARETGKRKYCGNDCFHQGRGKFNGVLAQEAQSKSKGTGDE